MDKQKNKTINWARCETPNSNNRVLGNVNKFNIILDALVILYWGLCATLILMAIDYLINAN
jgi:hypothetical protein